MGTTVIRGSNGTETFLPRRVPDLQFNDFVVQVDGANFLHDMMEKRGKRESNNEKKEQKQHSAVLLCKALVCVDLQNQHQWWK